MGLLSGFKKLAGSAMGGFGLGLAGDLFSAKSSRRAARGQMAFQERMSNTSHYREAQDLENAGLNRILSVTGGPGASTPGGAMATIPAMGSTALQGMRIRAEIKNIESLTDLNTKKGQALKPVSEFGRGLGAIAHPVADVFETLAREIPASAVSLKRQAKSLEEKVRDYLFEKSHKQKPFHGRKEKLR